MPHPNHSYAPRAVVFAIAFAATGALAGDPAAKAAPSQFGGMDANRDGRISSAEHVATTKKMFGTIDANGDGKVTAAEMDAAHERVTGQKAAVTNMGAAEKIKVIDADGDGVLTAAEHAAGSKAMFEKMDANKDGQLNRAEWDAGHAGLKKKP